ncbi:type IV secretion system protein [Bartonella sp. AU18XJBT]|uniref:type IV secretion system protein n=1 Tax=Bartonella sp. AU18XJBT TaxID=3019089 RepID=UPI00235E1F49|nr:type IV secretion system protein [Bartonella sp. AU18XJBT]
MKKKIISIAVTITLGFSNSAMAWSWGAGAADLGASVSTSWFNWSSPRSKKPAKKPASPQQKEISLREILEVVKKQLEETKKIHQSIMGNRKFEIKSPTEIQTDQNSFFLKNPELIYNKTVRSAISASLKNILNEEDISTSTRESRDSIGKRMQYATAIDKAVSLQTFQETENRFKKISELVEKLDTTTDLKSIAELQARIKGMLAMIQNEATKLQMVAYSRNAERALISQQKQKRNIRILNSENKGMPIIRSIR